MAKVTSVTTTTVKFADQPVQPSNRYWRGLTKGEYAEIKFIAAIVRSGDNSEAMQRSVVDGIELAKLWAVAKSK